jgi:hypothetical protein
MMAEVMTKELRRDDDALRRPPTGTAGTTPLEEDSRGVWRVWC